MLSVGHPANSGFAVDVNPASAVARQAREAGDQVVISYPGLDLTYAELDDRAARLAATLRAGGARSGDRVAYVGFNSPAFLITMLATFRIGTVFVPVNFRLAGRELSAVLAHADPVALVGEHGHRDVIDSVREPMTERRHLLVDDDPATPVHGAIPGWAPWSVALADANAASEVVPARFDDHAILMYTSGTTGLPKGVTLTYGNIWWNSVNVDSRIDTRRGDVTYAAAPLFHVGALNSFVLRTIVRGGRVVLRRSFDPRQFLSDIVEHRVNSLFAVPAMLAAVAKVPGAFDEDLSALRSVVVAGAPVPPALITQFAERGVLLQQAWGLTETAPFATHLPLERTLDKLGSAGIAMPHTEVRVVDVRTNRPVQSGETGEIVVRGPNVTPGYWQDPEATAAAFDADGWFHSGDVGYFDADGYLFIADRLKDMIISGGENIYPAEVEHVLTAMPGVGDVAVVGAPDDEWGEIVVAVVSPERRVVVTLEQIREYAANHLARYKLPRRLQVVDRIPRNASGKIDKRRVRQLLHDLQPDVTEQR